MPRIPDTELEQLKQSVSLAELCRARGIELKPNGTKDLVGLCPFHKDTKPSFVVSPGKNLFHCMGCGAAGSVIDFVMKADGIGFKEAAKRLLTTTGLVRAVANPPQQPTVLPERARQLLERVVAIYATTFAETPDGKKYLEGRGIGDAGLFIQHRAGFSNGTLCNLLPKDGPIKEELKAIGILLDNGRERFAGCVVFPVFDADGHITTLYGRFTGEGPKRHVFLPERSTGLWNVAAVKTHSEIILVESVIDALAVMMAGHRNVIAIQGTNGFDERDAQTLKTHGVQTVTLLLDGDDAGKKAAERLKERLSAAFRCRVLTLPDGLDPNAFLQAHGPRKLGALLAEPAASDPPGASGSGVPVSGPGFSVSYGMRCYRIMGLEKSPRKLKATVRVEHAGKLHVDTLDFYSARSRQLLAQDICRIYEEMPETIADDLQRLLVECEKHQPTGETRPEKSALERMSAREKETAETFGKSPDLIEKILADFETCGLIGEENNKLLGYIAMTSRKRDTPLSLLILSSSGAGKTALQDAVLAFCPPEDLVKLTALSGKALFYKEQTSLKHKVLALEEGDGAEDASYAIRNLISAKELVSESTIKDLATGRLTTMENKVEGPASVFLTTTHPEIDPETKSRFFVTSIDESREQTRKILLFQRRLHESDGLIDTPETDAVLRKHRNFQRLLQPVAVKNPYATRLTYGDDRLQGRRDQPKYLNLIKAIAFLRQLRKETVYEQKNGVAVPAVAVDADDIRLANQLANEILGHSLDELSRPGRDLLAQLEVMAQERLKVLSKEQPDHKRRTTDLPFSRRDIREYTGWTNTRLHIHLKELVDFEYIVIENGRNGTPFRYRLAWEGQGKDGKRFLLGLKGVDDLAGPGAPETGGNPQK